MTPDSYYILIGLLVFAINALPALMPPTWMILAFFYLHFNLQLLPLVIIGAFGATGGRIILFEFSRLYIRRFFPEKWLKNYDDLGKYFKKNQQLTIPIVLTYAFFPVPSNQVFIIAGLANLDIKIIAFSFLVGRMISYTFWVVLANKVMDNLENLFIAHLTNASTIAIELIGFSLIIIIGKINWRKILKF